MFRFFIILGFLFFMLHASNIYPEIRMGLKDIFIPVMEVDNVSANELYFKEIRTARIDLTHPEKGVESVNSCNEIVRLFHDGYTPISLDEYSSSSYWLSQCLAIRDIATLKTYDYNLFSNFNGGLTRYFPDQAPSSFARFSSHSDMVLLVENLTWGELDNVIEYVGMNITGSAYESCFITDDDLHYCLNILDVGDYNGDGYADMVVLYNVKLDGKALQNVREQEDNEYIYMYFGYFILSKTKENEKITIIKRYRSSIINGVNIPELENRYAGGNTSLRRDVDFIRMLLAEIPLEHHSSWVASYNNIAYYLEQSGNYESAIFLLNKIVEKVPDRTVAYINLGDAHWGAEHPELAREAYQTYVHLMRESNREQRIPQRVFERIGE